MKWFVLYCFCKYQIFFVISHKFKKNYLDFNNNVLKNSNEIILKKFILPNFEVFFTNGSALLNENSEISKKILNKRRGINKCFYNQDFFKNDIYELAYFKFFKKNCVCKRIKMFSFCIKK